MYLLANALIVLATSMLLIVRWGNAKLRRPVSYRHQLQLGYLLTVLAVTVPCLAPLAGGTDVLPMTTQVWSAPSMQALEGMAANPAKARISASASRAGVPLDVLASTIIFVCLAGVVASLVRISAGLRSVRRVVQQAASVRRAGALRILATDDASVPFSYWIPGRCFIVVPSELIARPGDLAMALAHEGQHHRQGDTRLIYAIEFLRGVFFLNPVAHVLWRQLADLQEFACDEALIVRRRLSVRAYCECLLWVAQSSAQAPNLSGCLHMAGARGAPMLSRRIAAVLGKPAQYLQRRAVVVLNALAMLAVLASGVVLSDSVQDRRVSRAQAEEMVALAQAGSTFPIVLNEQVLAELNRFLGTPDGREFLRGALERMAAHEALISVSLERHGLPRELLAVPLVESGFRNLPQSANPRHGAGIWMFIAPTARQFALTVEPGNDERLKIAAETEAAMRMFSNLYAEFGDWGFALLAYNGGSQLVRRAIQEGKADDAFRAAGLGYENDRGYVARVMAAVIVLRNAHRLRLEA